MPAATDTLVVLSGTGHCYQYSCQIIGNNLKGLDAISLTIHTSPSVSYKATVGTALPHDPFIMFGSGVVNGNITTVLALVNMPLSVMNDRFQPTITASAYDNTMQTVESIPAQLRAIVSVLPHRITTY